MLFQVVLILFLICRAGESEAFLKNNLNLFARSIPWVKLGRFSSRAYALPQFVFHEINEVVKPQYLNLLDEIERDKLNGRSVSYAKQDRAEDMLSIINALDAIKDCEMQISEIEQMIQSKAGDIDREVSEQLLPDLVSCKERMESRLTRIATELLEGGKSI